MPARIGRYRILCELGQGSMAVLYLGRTFGLGGFERLFAVKMIHEHLCREQSFIDMFLNEARIVARIHHPNVVPVYEIDVDKGRYYLAMDYVSGETLGQALSATWNHDRPFMVEQVAHIVACACEGLHAAHEVRDSDDRPFGIIHRDMAPQNVMLGYDGTVRVMDFGIAKALDTISGTRPGTLKGTIAYMSPEQVRGQQLDRRVDTFALGIVLWEASVGMRLFKHKNDIQTAARVLKLPIPKPSTIRKDYPEQLEAIVLKALERDPDERYQTARELGDDLQDFLSSSGNRVGASDIEKLMVEIFSKRHDQRKEMERKALEPEPPSNIEHIPFETSRSLRIVDDDGELDIEGVELFDHTDTAEVQVEQIEPGIVVARPEGPQNGATTEDASPEAVETKLKQPPIEPDTEPTVVQAPPKPPVPSTTSVPSEEELVVERGPGRWIALVALLAVVVLAVYFFGFRETTKDPVTKDVPAVPTKVKDPVANKEPDPKENPKVPVDPPSEKVTITFDVEPAEAEILVNDAPQVGQLVLEKSDVALEIYVSAKGHEPYSATIKPETTQTVQVKLKPIKKKKKKKKKKKRIKKRDPKKTKTKKKDGLLFRGNDID